MMINDAERNKTVFHNITPDLQDQDLDRTCPKTDGHIMDVKLIF